MEWKENLLKLIKILANTFLIIVLYFCLVLAFWLIFFTILYLFWIENIFWDYYYLIILMIPSFLTIFWIKFYNLNKIKFIISVILILIFSYTFAFNSIIFLWYYPNNKIEKSDLHILDDNWNKLFLYENSENWWKCFTLRKENSCFNNKKILSINYETSKQKEEIIKYYNNLFWENNLIQKYNDSIIWKKWNEILVFNFLNKNNLTLFDSRIEEEFIDNYYSYAPYYKYYISFKHTDFPINLIWKRYFEK